MLLVTQKNGSHKDCRNHAMNQDYALRLANPISASPEPNNQIIEGSGTLADIKTVFSPIFLFPIDKHLAVNIIRNICSVSTCLKSSRHK